MPLDVENPYEGDWKVLYKLKEAAFIQIEIKNQSLYYKDGQVRSSIADKLLKNLNNRLGEDWGYIAGTITESVRLEESLFDVSVNTDATPKIFLVGGET